MSNSLNHKITIDLQPLYARTEQAKLEDIPVYEKTVLDLIPNGADVVLTGRAPVWMYLRLAHAVHGKARSLWYDSPVTGQVEIFNHNPN